MISFSYSILHVVKVLWVSHSKVLEVGFYKGMWEVLWVSRICAFVCCICIWISGYKLYWINIWTRWEDPYTDTWYNIPYEVEHPFGHCPHIPYSTSRSSTYTGGEYQSIVNHDGSPERDDVFSILAEPRLC